MGGMILKSIIATLGTGNLNAVTDASFADLVRDNYEDL